MLSRMRRCKGQMLIESLAAVAIAATVLTTAAAALIGHSQAIARIEKVVPQAIESEGRTRLNFMAACRKDLSSNCVPTEYADIMEVRPAGEADLPMLIYAQTGP